MQPPDDRSAPGSDDRLRTDGGSEPGTGGSGDDGRSTKFWIAVALVLIAIPVLLVGLVLATVVGSFVIGIDDGSSGPPHALFNSSYDADAAEVTFEHVGVEPVSEDSLVVTVDARRTENWSAPPDELAEGDQVVVSGVDPGQTVTLEWHGEAGVKVLQTHRDDTWGS